MSTWRKLAPGQTSQLVTINRDGSDRRVVYETNDLIEAPNWTLDGKWLIFNFEGRLYRISPNGGSPVLIDTSPINSLNNDHVLSPDGKTVFVSNNDGHLYKADLKGGQPTRVSNDHPGRAYRYYLHGISPDGATLAYVGLERVDDTTKTWICTIPAAGGEDVTLTDGACPVDGPEYSVDGKWIFFNSEAAATVPGHAHIFRIPASGGEATQLTFDDRVNWFPHPSPDGQSIAFISFPSGTLGHPADKDVIMRIMDMDGGNVTDLDRFNGGQGTINVNSWSPDSRRFAYVAYPIG